MEQGSIKRSGSALCCVASPTKTTRGTSADLRRLSLLSGGVGPRCRPGSPAPGPRPPPRRPRPPSRRRCSRSGTPTPPRAPPRRMSAEASGSTSRPPSAPPTIASPAPSECKQASLSPRSSLLLGFAQVNRHAAVHPQSPS